MTSVLKCISCNIVIDELLAYIQNKVSIADEASLVKICASAFTTEQIKKSKILLLESLSSEVSNTVRKGKGKENRVLNDIIGIFKATDPDILPVFVARDLNKLPPITFDHLDVSHLLKDLALVQAEIKSIKSSYVTHDEFRNLQEECDKKYFSRLNEKASDNVNTKRGAHCDNYVKNKCLEEEFDQNCELEILAGDINSPEGKTVQEQQCNAVTHGDSALSSSAAHDASSRPTVTVSSSDPVEQLTDSARVLNKSYASAISAQKNDDYTLVQKKKKHKERFKGNLGRCIVELDEKFKSADKNIPMFISNVHKDTLELDITNYILKRTGEKVNLEKINIKRMCDHKAYKFFVSRSVLPIYMDEKLWPRGIIFRRFVNYRLKQTVNNNMSSVEVGTQRNK